MLVEVAFNDLLRAMPQEKRTATLSKNAIDTCLQNVEAEELTFLLQFLPPSRTTTTGRANASARIAQLYAKELAYSVDDMTCPLPSMHFGSERRHTTRASPKERAGLEIAYHRGLRLLQTVTGTG